MLSYIRLRWVYILVKPVIYNITHALIKLSDESEETEKYKEYRTKQESIMKVTNVPIMCPQQVRIRIHLVCFRNSYWRTVGTLVSSSSCESSGFKDEFLYLNFLRFLVVCYCGYWKKDQGMCKSLHYRVNFVFSQPHTWGSQKGNGVGFRRLRFGKKDRVWTYLNRWEFRI